MNKISVEICVGTYCHLMGTQLIIEGLEQLPEEIKERVQIKYKSCMNQCSNGSKVRIEDTFIENADVEQVISTIMQYVKMKR